ncbi:Helicase conserved C-terminal domain family protein [Saccharomyces cerevisiae]|nr:Helicase conserved C-terminal domain family protein [Saccharomyces cerevisiae]
MDINELKRSEDLSRGLSSYPTRMFNLIKEKSEVPLGHVHKIWKKVESQPEEALKLLLALFEIEPESKAIVVASTTNEVEELACSWRKYFRVVWIHGKLGAAEKVSRTKEFVTDGSMRVLIGTKLVTEGIDIKQLMMVIMLDNRLNIIELIQGYASSMDLNQRKEKKGQHVGCCGSRTDLSADTVELIERMDRLAEKQATASMSIVALPSSFQESNSSDRCRKYCSSDEDSNTCIHGSANASTNATTNSSTNATTTASINVRTSATTTASINSNTSATTTESTDSNTSATTTASINVRTSATTTESTNSSTNATTTASTNVRTSATTTASINVRTSATTTESTDSNTSATTTESTNSNTSATTTASTNSSTNATTTASTNSSTNATTTASTNSSTNATTTESTNASAKEDANKDGNAEDNRFHPVTDINKESYKRKGSQMVLLERKKLKAQFPNTSENMNVLQFLDFGLTKLNIFSSMVLTYTSAQRAMAWEALAVERMLRNDEEYKEYLEDIEPYHGDPVGYLKFFSVKRREIYSQIQRNYAWYLAITRRRETISVLDSTRGKQGSQVFRMSGRQIKELYYKVWSNLRESKTEVLQYFLNWDEKKCREEWEAKDDTVFVEALEKVGVFQRLRSMTSAGLQGPQYVKLQFSRHHRQLRSRYELSLGMHLRDQIALGVTPSKVPDWTAFLSMLIGLFYNKTFRQKLEYLLEQISEVVPLYMLMVAVHKELDSDDVPDGRFDILLCRDSSREVGE